MSAAIGPEKFSDPDGELSGSPQVNCKVEKSRVIRRGLLCRWGLLLVLRGLPLGWRALTRNRRLPRSLLLLKLQLPLLHLLQ